MKIDMHVHSRNSKRPAEWLLQKIGCPESFTEPLDLYRTAKQRGMTHVTITDHNVIEGCLEIAHMSGVFISEEVTTYFPEDGCKLHVLVYNIKEKQHDDIQHIRRNVYDLVKYLFRNDIQYALAHPLYSINGKLTIDHFEKSLLLFKNFELNGARSNDQNRCIQAVASSLKPEDIDYLSNRHDLAPYHTEPWKKHVVGGSDDHSGITIARSYTEVENAFVVSELFEGLDSGSAKVVGVASTPYTLAHNIYSIAYQFYGSRFNLDKYVNSDVIFSFLEKFLIPGKARAPRFFARFNFFWRNTAGRRECQTDTGSVLSMFRTETHHLIWDDPELSHIFRNGVKGSDDLDEKWFRFVKLVSNKLLCHFADHIIDSLSGAHFVNLFHSLGSAGTLYAVLAPYFVAFSVFSQDRKLTTEVEQEFILEAADSSYIKVAHFTDTFYEVNGVAGTLQKQIKAARKTNKDYTIVTCANGGSREMDGVHNFEPIRAYELPVYQEQKLFYPPFMEMLDYCYKSGFTHIHSATPGPLGLAALAISRILKLPVVGTYHTAVPQYAEYLTGDNGIAELTWKYIVWYYDQMDLVFVPSESTRQELVDKGIDNSKIRIFPRGIDTELFHPSKRNDCLDDQCEGTDELRLIYVGRISKEKNLPLLVNVFKKLIKSHGQYRLVIVGDGPYREEMEKELKGLPTVFTGYLEGEDLASVYASCDLFVFPSTTDTFGNVVLEAQASGLPVVVTNQGGPKENLIPGRTGLVAKGDDEKNFIRCINGLVGNPENLQLMSRAAREYAQTRSFNTSFEQTWKLYSELTPKADINQLLPFTHWPGKFAGNQ